MRGVFSHTRTGQTTGNRQQPKTLFAGEHHHFRMGSYENRENPDFQHMTPEISISASPLPTTPYLGGNSKSSAIPGNSVQETQQQSQSQNQKATVGTGSAANVVGSSKTRAYAKSKKTSQLKSVAWSYFDKFITEDGKNKAKCKNCPQIYDADSGLNGTKNLLAHIKKCPGNPENYVVEPKQQSLTFKSVEKGKEGMLTSWHFNQQASRSALAEMLVTDELPLSFVEGQGFKKFLSVLYPNFKIPSRKSSTRDF